MRTRVPMFAELEPGSARPAATLCAVVAAGSPFLGDEVNAALGALQGDSSDATRTAVPSRIFHEDFVVANGAASPGRVATHARRHEIVGAVVAPVAVKMVGHQHASGALSNRPRGRLSAPRALMGARPDLAPEHHAVLGHKSARGGQGVVRGVLGAPGPQVSVRLDGHQGPTRTRAVFANQGWRLGVGLPAHIAISRDRHTPTMPENRRPVNREARQ